MSSKRVFKSNNRVNVLGEFVNAHGEEFVVFNFTSFPHDYFVTGDELDWEFDWRTNYPCTGLKQDFQLTDDERDQVDTILERNHNER